MLKWKEGAKIKAESLKHKWEGTKLFVKNEGEEWGEGIELKGLDGRNGGGGIHQIKDATDIDYSPRKTTNGQALVWNSVNKKWEAGTVAGSSITSVDELSPSQTGNSGKFLKTDGTNATWEAITGGGDMLASTYDPTAIGASAFDMANMVEASDAKILTAAERAAISANTAKVSYTDSAKVAGIEAGADVTDAGNVGSSIHGATAKTTPVDADTIPAIDSQASSVLKKITWANIKATLKTYFDTLYNNYSHPNHSGDVTSVADGTQTISNGAVSLAKMANLAQSTIIGRVTGSTGVPEALTATNVRTIINVENGADVTDATNVAAAGAYMSGGTDVAITDGGTGASTAAAAFTALKQAATSSSTGVVELATTAETTTGTDATRAVTPDGLHDMTSLAGAAWMLDEDNMVSNSATKVASQQSIKAYADTKEPAKGTDDNYVTDAEKVVIGNTSGTNTGDQDLSGLVALTGNQTITGTKSIANDVPLEFLGGAGGTNSFKSGGDGSFLFDIGGGNNTRIKLGDNAGAKYIDFADSGWVQKHKFDSAGNATHVGTVGASNLSGTNTGDESQSTIKTKLGAATASVDGYATATQIAKLNGIETGAEVNNISDVNATDLTDGGDTTLHDHAGISENTAARHTQNTDTALGSGCVAADHGTGTTDQVVNVCYGTSATPPTASTTTEGTIYIQHAA